MIAWSIAGAWPPPKHRSMPEPPSRSDGSRRSDESRPHARLQSKAVVVAVAAVVLFFTGLPLELVALGAAGVMLLGRM